jgi:adenine-specific DNA-methyltransferase
VLGGLLLSDVANLFVGAYCVKMRGGCYRFQAQYLRQIRVPEVSAITQSASRELQRAFAERDRDRATATAARLYDIDLARLR